MNIFESMWDDSGFTGMNEIQCCLMILVGCGMCLWACV